MITHRIAPSRSPARRTASKNFSRVFDSVSTLVQRQIVEQALIPFLDSIPRKDAKRAIIKARRIAKKSNNVPQLDLAAKKSEVNGLLDELAKDTKSFTRPDASKYETLLREVVESVVEWLNDLWSLTYEFSLDFPRAHSCLLFSMGVLDHVQGMKGGGCRCIFSTVYVPITIRDSSGDVVKEFSELGLSNVESAILWVWREVFLALLSSNSPPFVKLMPELLAEIDDIIGWRGLERLVLGGATYTQCAQESGRRYDQRHDHMPCSHCQGEAWNSDLDVDDDIDDMFYAEHWNYRFTRCVPRLRRLVQDRMIAIFKASPSVQLYSTLVSLATDDTAIEQLHGILSRLATTSATSLSTAIEIYALDNKPDNIAALLDTHAFLLRPRDSDALQEAVRTLAGSIASTHRTRALKIAEKELLDATYSLRHAMRGPFSRIDSPSQSDELVRIAKMRRGSAGRQERVESWVEAASTPGLGPANPMAFAAMMMGLPVPAALDADEADHLGFIDLDPHDPDFMELREEYRPDLRGRFDGWVDTIEAIAGGPAVLEKVYKQISAMMPWILGSDIVEEMIGRIADKPSKHHVCDALESLAAFAKAQRKKRKKKMTNHVASAAVSTPTLVDEGVETEEIPVDGHETPDEPENEDNEDDADANEPVPFNIDPGPVPFFPVLGGIEDLD